ncbi:class I SAM-dependent methyltransferase [Streptomyces radiopugnans]|nr:class I SAM-dependent methyltransferase [Streptomyces radiopugnans]
MTATEPWMIDELAHAGPEHLDPAFVAGFDRKQGHPDPAPDIDALRRHGVGRDATVVDLGAGTGRFALAAAREFTRVVAADVSPAMLDHLRARAGREAAANLECVRARLPHLRAHRAARRRRAHPARPPPTARLLQGAGAGPHRPRTAARRCAPPARPRLRLPAG